MQSRQNIPPLALRPTIGRNLTSMELLPEEKGICALHQAHQLLESVLEKRVPKTPSFENQ